ncbi:hypothetical protein PFUGPA_04235 [Plasmodium falciparum Palo Alto/Uganda]|uniref:Uncharacterized protein n=1 Tax=Plasmodium falciparum (isolate Palo Alto / Uganda) TaxID=57270 RepID=W4IYD4_PLAFP|nr:hypothetical protein PFUGPA_04235 [Plasmodium falciparum Palo Alto/Uganda]
MTENYIQYIPVFEKKPDMREILINRRNQKKIGTRNIKEKNFEHLCVNYYLYINNNIKPNLDDYIYDLYDLYQISGSLNISYSFTPAY